MSLESSRDTSRGETVLTARISDRELAAMQWKLTDRIVEKLAERLAEALLPAALLHVRVNEKIILKVVERRVTDQLVKQVLGKLSLDKGKDL